AWGGRGRVTSLLLSPDGRRVVTFTQESTGSTARVWDAVSGAELVGVWRGGAEEQIAGLAFSPAGGKVFTRNLDAAQRRWTACLWETASGRLVQVLHSPAPSSSAAAFSPDGKRVLTTCENQTAHVWEVRSGREVLTLRGGDQPVREAVFTPDGSQLLTRGV